MNETNLNKNIHVAACANSSLGVNAKLNNYLDIIKPFKGEAYSCILDEQLVIRAISDHLAGIVEKRSQDIIGLSFLSLPRPLSIQEVKLKIFTDAIVEQKDLCYLAYNSQVARCRLVLVYGTTIISQKEVLGFELNLKELFHIPYALFYQGAQLGCCLFGLTPHQSEIAFLKSQRKTNKEIAITLSKFKGREISHNTIKSILLDQIYPKLKIANQIEFFEKMEQLKLISEQIEVNKDFILPLY